MDFSSITYEETPLRRRRRAFILRKAFEIMTDKGIAETALIDIIEAVGMTPRNIYYYYPNKDAVVFDVHRGVMENLIRMEFIQIPHEGTAYDRLYSILKQFYDYLLKNPRMMRFIGDFDCVYLNSDAYHKVVDKHRSVQKRIREMIEVQTPLYSDGTLNMRNHTPEDIWFTTFHSMNSLIQRYVRHSVSDQETGYIAKKHIYLQLELLMASIKS